MRLHLRTGPGNGFQMLLQVFNVVCSFLAGRKEGEIDPDIPPRGTRRCFTKDRRDGEVTREAAA